MAMTISNQHLLKPVCVFPKCCARLAPQGCVSTLLCKGRGLVCFGKAKIMKAMTQISLPMWPGLLYSAESGQPSAYCTVPSLPCCVGWNLALLAEAAITSPCAQRPSNPSGLASKLNPGVGGPHKMAPMGSHPKGGDYSKPCNWCGRSSQNGS